MKVNLNHPKDDEKAFKREKTGDHDSGVRYFATSQMDR